MPTFNTDDAFLLHMRTDDELRSAIAECYWYHSIELRPGIITPGIVSGDVLPFYQIPPDLSGKTVLDIGCWDGFFAFECERRGAKRVVAADIWENSGRGAFDLAREELNSRVEPLESTVYDLPGKLGGERFDLILFLGVLYHLRHPLLALEKLAECHSPGGLVIIDTVVDYETATLPRPMVAFYPKNEMSGDPTSWWGPNPHAVAAMLGVAGYASVMNIIQLWLGNRSVFHAVKAEDADVKKMEAQDYRDRHSRPRRLREAR